MLKQKVMDTVEKWWSWGKKAQAGISPEHKKAISEISDLELDRIITAIRYYIKNSMFSVWHMSGEVQGILVGVMPWILKEEIGGDGWGWGLYTYQLYIYKDKVALYREPGGWKEYEVDTYLKELRDEIDRIRGNILTR